MSPSEDKGLALGLRLLRFDKAARTTALPSGKLNVTKVFAQFESPAMPNVIGSRSAGRRHYLNAYAKSRAGAWRIAVRWWRQLQRGELR